MTGLQVNPGWRHGALLSPDSFMRLVRLDDMLAAGRMLHTVQRDGSGAGTIVHWSHCLDGLLLVLAAPLAPWLGWHAALGVAGLLSGPLSLAGLGAAVAWTAAPVARPGWLWLGAFAAGSATTLRNYGLLGQVSHHVLLALCVVMAAGWVLRVLRGTARPALGGGWMGAWCAAGLWLSPETLPFTLMAAGALWVAWFADPDRLLARALAAHAGVLLGGCGLILALDPPAGGVLAAQPDRISLPFLELAAFALVTALTARRGLRRVALVVGATCCVDWLITFPQVLHGTAGLMTPAQAAAFFTGIEEMAPARGLGDAVNFLAGGSVAAGVLAGFAWRARGLTRFWPLAWAAGCTLVALVLSAAHVRFAAYPQAAGAVLLPVLLSAITASGMALAAQSMGRLAAILVIVGLPSLYALVPKPPGAVGAAAACDMAGAVRLLAGRDGQIVLTDPNDTPEILYRTRVLTVGSLYHRGIDGFMRLRAAWRGTDAAALDATGARLVLACPSAGRSVLVGDLPETTLLDRVNRGDPPGGLVRVGADGGFVLYQRK